MCISGMKVRFMKSCFPPPATVVPTEEPATPGRFTFLCTHLTLFLWLPFSCICACCLGFSYLKYPLCISSSFRFHLLRGGLWVLSLVAVESLHKDLHRRSQPGPEVPPSTVCDTSLFWKLSPREGMQLAPVSRYTTPTVCLPLFI